MLKPTTIIYTHLSLDEFLSRVRTRAHGQQLQQPRLLATEGDFDFHRPTPPCPESTDTLAPATLRPKLGPPTDWCPPSPTADHVASLRLVNYSRASRTEHKLPLISNPLGGGAMVAISRPHSRVPKSQRHRCCSGRAHAAHLSVEAECPATVRRPPRLLAGIVSGRLQPFNNELPPPSRRSGPKESI